MTSTEGNDEKQYRECPLVSMILIGFQWLPIWCPIAGTTSHLAKLSGDHLHLISKSYSLPGCKQPLQDNQSNVYKYTAYILQL